MTCFSPLNLVLHLADEGIISNTAFFLSSLTNEYAPRSNIPDAVWMFWEFGLPHYVFPEISQRRTYDVLQLFPDRWRRTPEPQRLAHSTRFYKELAQLRRYSTGLPAIAPEVNVDCATVTQQAFVNSLCDGNSSTSALSDPQRTSYGIASDNGALNVHETCRSAGPIDIQINKADSQSNRPCTPSVAAQRSRRSRRGSSSQPTAQSARSSTSFGPYSPVASSAFNSAASSVSSVTAPIPCRNTKEYPAAEWRRRRREITELYIKQDLTLNEVQTIMKQRGFDATYRQYKRKFEDWQLKKNFTLEDKLIIIAKQLRRKNLGKQTAFVLNGKPIGDSKLRQLLKGVRCSAADLLGDRKTPPQITYFTPPEGDDFIAALHAVTKPDMEPPSTDVLSEQSGHNCGHVIERTRLSLTNGLGLNSMTSSLMTSYCSENQQPFRLSRLPEVEEEPVPVSCGLDGPSSSEFSFDDVFETIDESYPVASWCGHPPEAVNEDSDWLGAVLDTT